MKKWIACMIVSFIMVNAISQPLQRPKLVVGVVVDQMRWDLLYRYQARYGNDGFKRIVKEGFSCENTFIPYTPTYTAAGHACVYTGSVPALHGIMGNYWYSKELGRNVYCTEDSIIQTVGSNSAAGKMSPRNLWSTNISDEIRLASNFKSKTIAIALKDRGSILPGGHTANAAYWFDNESGGWISSSFYMSSLPRWVADFNARKLPDASLKQSWNTLYPLHTYTLGTTDDKPYEDIVPGEDNTFPHQTDTIQTNKYDAFRYTPGGNSFTFEMARAAIKYEQLGKREVTDVLAVSFSSPDYIGHRFGPNSIEMEDMYLRFDKELGAFLKYLDETVGKGQYLLFLTADHGVAHTPGFLKENKIPGGTFDDAVMMRQLNESLQKEMNISNSIAAIINYQVYLNDTILLQQKLDKHLVKQRIIDAIMKYPYISRAFDMDQLSNTAIPMPLKMMVTNGYNQKLSGDIQFILKPQWFDGWDKGTSHGVWNPYDAHIPLLWFGWKIKPGKLDRKVYMTDIAPTVASLLQIQMPNATIGEVITEVGK